MSNLRKIGVIGAGMLIGSEIALTFALAGHTRLSDQSQDKR